MIKYDQIHKVRKFWLPAVNDRLFWNFNSAAVSIGYLDTPEAEYAHFEFFDWFWQLEISEKL